MTHFINKCEICSKIMNLLKRRIQNEGIKVSCLG